jgi:predicted TIM-barrel fold metal-dependent hydrolase
MRTIALEEHYVSPLSMEGPGSGPGRHGQSFGESSGFAQFVERLQDIGERRIADMDAAGIDMQVLSLAFPAVEQLDATRSVAVAREANDYLADAVRRHPSRFAAFAALPTPAPESAADELERTVRDFGFKGAMIRGHSSGRYLDDEFFWPILERAEKLGVPIALHPAPPPQPVIAASYTGNFSPEASSVLSTRAWGWHIETATHVLRLILSGAFDRYPNLQLVIGHMGEALPFMMPRIEGFFSMQVTKLARPIGAYFRENIHYTFSGFNFTATFLDLFLQVGVERIMFSADHPFSSMARARAFLDQLPVSSADRERIAHGNAERLLRLP